MKKEMIKLKDILSEMDGTKTKNIIDYHNSKNRISVGMKTNLLPDMKKRYEFEVNGDEIYFFDKRFHFGTLFKEGRFFILKHDGSLNDLGWRKS